MRHDFAWMSDKADGSSFLSFRKRDRVLVLSAGHSPVSQILLLSD